MNKLKLFAVAALTLLSLSASAQKEYKAALFNIKSNGSTLNTRSIQRAVDYINEQGGGTLVFYVGRYLTGPIELKSNVNIRMEEGAVLVASTNVYDYVMGKQEGAKALVWAKDQENIGMIGKGVIEGQGSAILESINTQITKGNLDSTAAAVTPAMVYFEDCTNVTVSLANMLNAAGSAVVLEDCTDATVGGLNIRSKEIAGSNGIVITDCTNVTVENGFIEVAGSPAITSGNTNLTATGCITPTGAAVSLK